METQVTCVVNAHKEGVYLYRALKSVLRNVRLAEKYGIGCEVIVLLDNPCESTAEIAENHCNNWNGLIKTVRCEYGDLAQSRNRAVQEAAGEYIGFLDGDDLWGDSWISSAFMRAKQSSGRLIIHPQYNVYFAKDKSCHVMEHISQDDPTFFSEFFHEQNYWTSLSFGPKTVYLEYPYKNNDLRTFFGYEDWTWNVETVQDGIEHTIAKNTLHFIRRGKRDPSLLDLTNKNCLPRVYPLYNESLQSKQKSKVAAEARG